MKFFANNIRKIYSIAVGKFLNDIWVQRYNLNTGQIVKEVHVPVMHGPKLHWWISKYNTIPDNFNVKNTQPLMSYSFTGMSYDASRQLNPLAKLESPPELSAFVKHWSLQATPWNFNFGVSIWTDLESDMDQIIEQVAYRFNPTYNLHIKEVPVFGGWRTCRLKLDNMASAKVSEWDIKGDRVLKWDIGLTLEGNIYPAIYEQRLLQYIELNYRFEDFTDTGIMSETFGPAVTVTIAEP